MRETSAREWRTSPSRPGSRRGAVVVPRHSAIIEARPIAGLRFDEHWYSASGEAVAGNTFRHKMPLQPGEVINVTLKLPHTAKLSRNQLTFAHVNGKIKQTTVAKLEMPKQEAVQTTGAR